MSRRARAAAFACAALASAGIAAALEGGYRSGVEDQLGTLVPVVVARADLPPHRVLGRNDVERLLAVRRVPARFVPPGALSSPKYAIGRAPATRITTGAYLLAGQLAAPGRSRHPRGPRLAPGREPVEITVTGAGALAAARPGPHGGRVDVIVTSEPGPGSAGRTYVAAEGVELLALSKSSDGDAGGYSTAGAGWTATLAVTRGQALRLIQAENFAREVRLIPSG